MSALHSIAENLAGIKFCKFDIGNFSIWWQMAGCMSCKYNFDEFLIAPPSKNRQIKSLTKSPTIYMYTVCDKIINAR